MYVITITNNSEPILWCASWDKVLDKDVCSRKMRVPVEFTYTMCYWQNKHTLYLYCYSSSIKDLKKKICIWGAVFPTETFSAFICASPAMLSQGLVCNITETVPESLDQSRLSVDQLVQAKPHEWYFKTVARSHSPVNTHQLCQNHTSPYKES